MNKISKQLKLIAKEIISLQLIAKGQKQLKKYIRDNLLYKNPKIDTLELSTEVGRINKIVKDKLSQLPSNYHRIVYDWLIDGNQIPQEDVQKMINSSKQYQVIKKNDSKTPNIFTFKTYGELISYIDKFNQNNNLQFLQKRNNARNTNLPFKKINSKGNYSMYIIESDQYQDLNRLYGNNNNSKEGGLIATTSWCVALGKNYFENYKAPYYLITKNNNQPEALVHINSHQFKDRDDYTYQGNNKQVYELVIQLLDDNNELNLEDDFQVLLKYLPNQKIQEFIDNLIDKKWFGNLFSYIEKGYLPELSNQQSQKIIDYYIDKKWFGNLLYYIKAGRLSELSNQKKQEIIDDLIDNKSFWDLFSYIREGYLPELSNQKKQEIIDYYIDRYLNRALFFYIKGGDLPELSNQQNQKIIDYYIDKRRFGELFDYIKEGYLPELSNQQKQRIREKDPNVKLSKNLINIAKSLIDII